MTQTQPNYVSSSCGRIKIADEVIAVIAGTAAQEVEGAVLMAGNFSGDIAEIMGRRNLSKGVRVSVKDGKAEISLHISVKYGFGVADVSLEVQKKIKTAIETMTALEVSSVDVEVAGVQIGKKQNG